MTQKEEELVRDIERETEWVERNLRGMVSSFLESTKEERAIVATTAIEVAMLKVAAEWSLMATEMLGGTANRKVSRNVFVTNAGRSWDMAAQERKEGTEKTQIKGKWVPAQ